MRRALTFAAAWLAAATVAVVVAWQGVGIVTRQVTDDRPSSLASDEVRELASAQTTTTIANTGPSPTSPSTTAPVVAPTASPSPTTTPPRVTPTTAPATASPTTTTVRSASPTTTAPPPAAETRTYNLVGGSAALRFAPEGVTVVWATPNSGFDVSVEPENVNGVKVEFESDSHRSRVDGWWSNGPQDRVREEER